MNDKVSVIIPTYKRPMDILSRAVESVFAQTYEHIELIVIDDSPDSYADRAEIQRYMQSKQNAGVIYMQNETNLGGSLSRNRGIDVATGAYISFLDDDDEYLPGKIERQVAYMRTHDVDLTFGNMIMYSMDGKVVDVREYHDIPSFDTGTLLTYHLMKHMTGTPTFMFKADKLREIGGFDDAKMGQEFYLMLKAIENGLKIGYIDACDVKIYKHNDGGISQGKNKIDGENALYEFKKRYFSRLTKREIRGIKFRHHAVMVVAYLRNRMYFRAVLEMFRGFFISPGLCFKEFIQFNRKRQSYSDAKEMKT